MTSTFKIDRKKIIIIGAGFAGLQLAKNLKNSSAEITLIDKHNYHEFSPLFYQIASCGLEPGAICFPLRKEFRNTKNIHFHMGDVISVNTRLHTVLTDTEELIYDILIIANGTTSKYFGMNQIKEFGYSLKTTAEGLMLRNQILLCLEKAAECNHLQSRRRMLTFIISGAGPAGVEIAGALGELKKYIIPREYPEIHSEEVQIILIEATDKVLRTMSNSASKKATRYLNELEVDIRLNTGIINYDGSEVITSNGEHITSDTLIWTAGVEGIKITGLEDADYGPSNRLLVNEYNQLIYHHDIFAIGDCCLMKTEQKPNGDPQVAQTAIQQAQNLAFNLKQGNMIRPFKYNDKGSMATIGRNRAVVDLKMKKISGRIAWWMWLIVHLITLIGIRNKIVTFINWVWNYFSYNSSLRLLIRPVMRIRQPIPTCLADDDISTNHQTDKSIDQ